MRLYIPTNINAKSIFKKYSKKLVKELKFPSKEFLNDILSSNRKAFYKMNLKEGFLELHIVGAEDIPQRIMMKNGNIGILYLDLLINYLYKCPSFGLKNAKGKYKDPTTIVRNPLCDGNKLYFKSTTNLLEVKILSFALNDLANLCLLVPKNKSISDIVREKRGKKIKVVCEKRFSNIAKAFLNNLKFPFTLELVTRKTEGYYLSGNADCVIDVCKTGETAAANGLKPGIKIITSYPIEIRCRRLSNCENIHFCHSKFGQEFY